MPYSQTFGRVEKGKPVVYLTSLLQLSFAFHQDSFANTYQIFSGCEWRVDVEIVKKMRDEYYTIGNFA